MGRLIRYRSDQLPKGRGDSLAGEGEILPLRLSEFSPWLLRLGNVLWFEHSDAWIAGEVFRVKGQEVGNAVDVHRGDKSSILHLHTRDRVPDEELSPLVIRGHAIGEETEIALDHPDPAFGRSGRKPKAATGRRWARAHTPKLGEDSRGEAQDFVAPTQRPEGISSEHMRRVSGIRYAQ
jgi:hypothetical protein